MICKEKFYVGFKDINKNFEIKNESLLTFFENIAGIHANITGDGLLDTINTSHTTWLLLSWKIKIIKRPLFGSWVEVSTWVRSFKRIYSEREFEARSETGELLAVGTSRWVHINFEKGIPQKCDADIADKYTLEEKTNFPESADVNIIETGNLFREEKLVVDASHIDMNYHMNNTHYLSLAQAVLKEKFDLSVKNFEVMYKKEVKEGSSIVCQCFEDEENIIAAIKSEDKQILHAIIKYQKQR